MGTLLRHYRVSLHISKSELASKAHISRQYLNRIERNLSFPTEPILKRISRVLNICPYELINFCTNCSFSNTCNRKHLFSSS